MSLYGSAVITAFVSVALVNCAIFRIYQNDNEFAAAPRQKRQSDYDVFDDYGRRGRSRKLPKSSYRSDDILNNINHNGGESRVIELDALDPRQQAVSSSYSIVETSKGPNSVTVTRTDHQYEPKKRIVHENRQPSSSGRNVNHNSNRNNKSRLLSEDNRKSQKIKFPVSGDEPSASSGKLSFDIEDASLDSVTAKKDENSLKKLKIPRNEQRKPTPNSISDIVEDRPPLQSASSSSSVISDDLKDSGTYLSGSLEDGFGGGYDKEKHFGKEGGKKYVQSHKAESGEKADQGYKKEDGYDKAEKEKHSKEQKKAVVKEQEGEKKAHVDQAKHFQEGYKGSEGEKGKSIVTKGGHKKGHKKSGFHKVHHKDEYKKDEVFYDEAHDDAEKEEHAHEKEKHAKEKGSAEKAGHVDSGYQEGHVEKKGLQDKGHHYEQATGHHKEGGKEVHHDEHAKYGKKKGIKEGKKYGHAEAGETEGGYHETELDHDHI